jgi:hypothetical protein
MIYRIFEIKSRIVLIIDKPMDSPFEMNIMVEDIIQF